MTPLELNPIVIRRIAALTPGVGVINLSWGFVPGCNSCGVNFLYPVTLPITEYTTEKTGCCGFCSLSSHKRKTINPKEAMCNAQHLLLGFLCAMEIRSQALCITALKETACSENTEVPTVFMAMLSVKIYIHQSVGHP